MHKLPSSNCKAAKCCTPHLFPCCIHHNGPVNAKPRYWNPAIGEDGRLEAYFRGRKLKGKEARIPEGYTGIVVWKVNGGNGGVEGTARQLECDGEGVEEEGDEGEGEELEGVQALEEVASFDKIVLWGHESLVEADDPFVKGVQEWIGFAEAMHKPGKAEGP